MQIFILFSGIIIGFLARSKFIKKPKKISTVNIWDRALSREEIVTLYKAYKLIRESYPKEV